MLRLLLAALWDAQTFCLGLGQLLEITIAHNKSCGCAFGFRFFCRAVVMHDWNTHTHTYIYIYMLRFSAVWLACLLFPYHITTGSPSPHCLGSLAGVFFYTKDIVEMFLHALGWCRMLEAPMHVGSCFSCFSFQIFALPGAPRDFEGTVHPSGKSSGIESTASNRQHGISCWMRSSRRQSFVRYEWSQSGRPKISTKRQVQCSAPQGYRQQGTKRQSHQCRR